MKKKYSKFKNYGVCSYAIVWKEAWIEVSILANQKLVLLK